MSIALKMTSTTASAGEISGEEITLVTWMEAKEDVEHMVKDSNTAVSLTET